MAIALILLLFLAVPAWGQSDYELSYLLVRTSDGVVLAEQEADKLRVPASTLKTLSAATALETLGPEHVFHTSLLSQAEIRRGRLEGDLYLKGSADSELTLQSLQSLVDQLSERGVRKVIGDLVVDPGPYAFPLYGPGWAWDDAGLSYSPEITGLNLDGGVSKVNKGDSPSWLVVHRAGESTWNLVPGYAGVQVWGEVPEAVAPPRLALRSGERLAALLDQQGIILKGRVVEGEAAGEVLAIHRSRPLVQILKRAMADSDNLAMELLFRASGEELPSALSEEKLRVVDGSGLSRYNLISCRQLVRLLTESDLRRVLPAPGEGTLKKRFLDGWAVGNIVAKSGSMSNVSALTGYLFPGTDKECVFAVMINGHLGKSAELKAIENELVGRWVREVGWPYLVDSEYE